MHNRRGPANQKTAAVDLGLSDDAPRPGDRLSRAEGARGALQERPRSDEITQLRHRDASQRESRRVVAQGDALQCA